MKQMKRRGLKVIAIALAAVMIACSPAVLTDASAASNTSLITSYLKYYKAGKYKKAKKYLNKMKKTNKDTSLKKMSKAQKKAYRKVVKKYGKDLSYSPEGFLWGYYLADLNKDKKPELLIKYGSCEADVQTFVYTYKKGKAKKIAELHSGHTGYVAYPGKGVLAVWEHMGYCSVSVMYMKNGKVTSKDGGSQQITETDAVYCVPENFLDSHIVYDANYNASIDYKPLK